METHNARALVARNVRRVRELRDRTQAELARQMDWPRSTLHKLESGSRNVTVDDLLSLALALHVAPAVLLVPWEDDEQLSVVINGGKFESRMDSAEAFGWIVGAPDPYTLALQANPVDYFSTTPVAVQRRYGQAWLRQVREELGWDVSDDGTQVTKPGISVRWGPRED